MQPAVQEHQHQAERIETLIQEVAAFRDPHARATTEELVQALLNMYGDGLARMLELTAESEVAGLSLINTFAEDELLSSLFLLHGLHPKDIETRVLEALDEVRPILKSHGGSVELIKIEEGRVHVRLDGSSNGCSSSTMKATIEEAINKAAPDLDVLEVEGVAELPARSVTPVTFVPRKRKDNNLSSTKIG